MMWALLILLWDFFKLLSMVWGASCSVLVGLAMIGYSKPLDAILAWAKK